MVFESLRELMRGIQGRFSLTEGPMIQSSQRAAFLRQIQKEWKQENVLNVPLEELNVVVIDFETTGFFPDLGDEIISIGAIRVNNGIICDKEVFYSLVHYANELPLEIEKLTGISTEELKKAMPLSDVLIHFFDFVKNDTLVAHHARHEKSFLQNASWKLFRAPFKHRIIDTSFLYRVAEPNLNMSRLEDLCKHNEIPVLNRHHALGDAKLAAKLWCAYITKIKQMDCNTLNDVYERLAK